MFNSSEKETQTYENWTLKIITLFILASIIYDFFPPFFANFKLKYNKSE